jgi:hypothetical protein
MVRAGMDERDRVADGVLLGDGLTECDRLNDRDRVAVPVRRGVELAAALFERGGVSDSVGLACSVSVPSGDCDIGLVPETTRVTVRDFAFVAERRGELDRTGVRVIVRVRVGVPDIGREATGDGSGVGDFVGA